jgi:hypothetical protein
MEANTLTLLFTFIPKVEENNDGAKDNDVAPAVPLQQWLRILYSLVVLHLELQLEVILQ